MSEKCCSITAPGGPPADCPGCGTRGKTVANETLSSLLREPCRGRVGSGVYRFCPAQNCDIVYFGAVQGARFLRSDVAVPVWQKESDLSCPVCYCFNHSAASIGEEVLRTGKSTVPDDIRQKVKEGQCACERENPQGSCCLGNVGTVVRQQLAVHGDPRSDSVASDQRGPAVALSEEPSVIQACCRVSGQESSTVAPDSRAQTGPKTSWLLAGSVVAAVVASACCWLPLMLVGLGLSAAGAGAVFEQWRPLFLTLTGLLLAAGFYFAYSRERACASGEACAVPAPRTRRLGRMGLWLATFLAIVGAAFPHYAGSLIGISDAPAAPAAGVAAGQQALSIGGMSCEACTAHVRKALLSVPGVLNAAVDYPTKTARVGFAAAGPKPNIQALREAVRQAGYQATLLEAGATQQGDSCCGL
ncbi:MAG: cation transporter [Candidatus Wallbacteria bacterium]|nr:cation transporter [Candidatus Wallbacteria bacterium]